MKKIIWVIVVLVVGGYFTNSYLENKTARKVEKAEAERIEQAAKSAVAQMVSQTNAVDDWVSHLSKGEKFRSEPILTVELERLWLQNRPILFIGSVSDIATQDQSHYMISVENNLSSSIMFDTELQLSLVADKVRIDSFLNRNPDLFKEYGFNNGVAVVARIKTIRTAYISGAEGAREEVKIGEGELVDIFYTGDILF